MSDLASTRLCWDCFFMEQVYLSGEMSTCRTRHYGGVLTRGNRVVAQGFNGNLPGHVHCDQGGCDRCAQRAEGTLETGANLSDCCCVHVEQNIVGYCAREGIPTRDTTLWLPANPCVDCMRLVVSAGVTEIVYADVYPAAIVMVKRIAEKSGVVMRRPLCPKSMPCRTAPNRTF